MATKPKAITVEYPIEWEKPDLTNKNKNNLRKLAKYLETVEEDKFDMTMYAYNSNEDEILSPLRVKKLYNECGTTACAMGHAAICFDLKKEVEDLSEIIDDDGWYYLASKLFGLDEGEESWEWCFGMGWEDVDNTPKGAAKRILMMLRWGVPYCQEFSMFSPEMVNFYKDFK